MRTKASRICGALLALLAIGTFSTAHANQYPPPNPGSLPNGTNPSCQSPDTLIRVEFIKNPNLPSATCHPIAPDTVWGIGGIVTGFDPITSGFAIYVQNSDGNPWGGVDVFTGGTNYINDPRFLTDSFGTPLALGDSLMSYGRMDNFQGEDELRGFASSAFNPPLPAVRRISVGNPLPPFQRNTVNYFRELNTNPNGKQWISCLVRASSDQHKLRVVRTSDQNTGLNTPNSFLLVDNVICPPNAVGPCDSLFVDGNTLTTVGPPQVGALVDSVQGIYTQRTRGFRVQLRGGNDLFDLAAPTLTDAYPIANGDSIRVVFDRDLTPASAQNVLNYTLGSTGFNADGAKQQVDKRVVHLRVTTASSAPVGGNESITVGGVVNNNNGQAMTGFQTLNFYAGILPISMIQAPDPASLSASPCVDRSTFAAAGNQATGGRMTTRGVCTAVMGSTYFIETATGGARSGLALFAPVTALVQGHQYLLAGGIQEFFGETELVSNVFARDEGVVAIPAPIVKTVHVLRDTTCDAAQSLDTADDYDAVLVRVQDVKSTDERTAGQNFFVAGQYPTNPDTILIDNNIARTFDPTKNQYVTVTGVLQHSFVAAGTVYRIQPRGNSDITVNSTLNVDDQLPTGVSFGISPNPGRASRITFALPTRQRVQIGVYDLAGRRRAVLADGEYPAGTTSLGWDGLDAEGHAVGAGVYFYKMRLETGIYTRRGVLLN
jgi:hypothetical protein